MLEIEQKFAGADFAALEARLAEWGARRGEDHSEADHYFNAPDRDFAVTGEAFRMRRIGSANLLTYKGPRQAGPVKIRPELEIALRESGIRMLRLYLKLNTGSRPEETLSAKSEIVPVGAMEVSSALRMPWRPIASRRSASSW